MIILTNLPVYVKNEIIINACFAIRIFITFATRQQLSPGVMAAQQILVLSVQVRIPGGQQIKKTGFSFK